ncbi:MAG: T9SS type A sorting domain-containing protein, partial [Prevotellaceae bacterium]|nr:T9SS type A sorting domain-containing protein [Prevotellaceae bacterium]
MKIQIIFIITVVLITNTLYAQFGGGTGSENDPYQIYTKAHLEELSDSLWAGNIFTGKHFVLMNDINDSLRFPIGHMGILSFDGYFHGQGHNIVLAIDVRGNSTYNHHFYNALFPRLNYHAYIDSFSVTGYIVNMCGLVGDHRGKINACINNLTSKYHWIWPNDMTTIATAGFADESQGNISNCVNNCNLLADAVGGICYHSQIGTQISNCTNNGTIHVYKNHIGVYAGGIIGIGYATISNCTNNGDISLISRDTSTLINFIALGGIGAYNYNNIINCQNYGNINAFDTLNISLYCGGIAGIDDNITNCANYGNIYTNSNIASGISSRGNIITNCFNSGTISGNNGAGILSTNEQFEIINCLNIGYRKNGSAIAIDTANTQSNISHNYYDKQRCLSKGINNEDISGKAEGKLTTELTGNSPALRAMLGNGWSYAEGRYPIPLGLENDSSAILHATPVYLYVDSVQYDHVDSVRHYFTVGTNSNNVTWASTEGKVSFDGQNATLLSLGSEVLTANMGNYFNSIPINIIDTIPVTFDTIPDHIATIPANSSITIYPNPATNQLKIKNYELRDGDKVEIYNMLGQQQPSILNPQFSIIDISSLPSGMYIIRVGKFVG